MALKQKLAALVAEARPGLDINQDTEMLETLLTSTAITIAMMRHGKTKLIDEILTGSESYLADRVMEIQPIAERLRK